MTQATESYGGACSGYHPAQVQAFGRRPWLQAAPCVERGESTAVNRNWPRGAVRRAPGYFCLTITKRLKLCPMN